MNVVDRHDLTRSTKEVPLQRGATRTPVRTCVGCRRTRPQDELRRLARTPDGIRSDPQRRLPGRGAYLCPQPSCIDAASRRDAAAVRRALRGGDAGELRATLEALRAEMSGTKQGVRHQVPEGTVRSESA